MNSSYSLLKSSNCLNMLNGDNLVVGRSKSSKNPSIFTAKNILKYCRLLVEPLKPKRPVGLALVPIIATEPRFKFGIIQRCELPLRIRSTDRRQHSQPCNREKITINQHITDPMTSFLPRENDSVIQKIPDSTAAFLPKKQDSDILLDADSTTSSLQVVSENEYDNGPESLPIKKNESETSLPPMLVNDIKSFALLDAKFREDAERYLSNESIVTGTEEFIRDIKPTYSDAKMKSCLISKHADDEMQNAVGGTESQILTVLKQDKSTKVIMHPRPSSSKKRDPAINEEQDDKKKPMLSKLKMITIRKDMFKKEKEKGWRIRESYQIYNANRSSTRVSRPCASELATSKSTASHPPVKSVTSTRLLLSGCNTGADKNRRNKEAEKRIRASFNAFVERQNHARTLRALKEQ